MFEVISWSLFGGILIGLAASLLLLFNGRIAGISGILSGVFFPARGDTFWRVAFIAGLLAGGVLAPLIFQREFVFELNASLPVLLAGGFLVGFGTKLGSGCTSGHSVCGIARFSWRSIVATITFMATAIITVAIMRHVL
ncbi:MAG: YeeE/YedE family protein [Gammaproteobacteria bacterium]|nr:YeeE/YedE family protein [Gammaproteobacteria bacterium]MAY03400.1 YeeE/YedE family protein [Gammaproteobacteria bacterium]|tara:strand:- start:428 stop:844 length:417 start_codon:yes stop_codon:yes gene_type:complete